ncbi:MAG: DUF805 domain-containing protein [Maledivibacter sp.]|jgi:uncharacterized membrane protein YhaH (DUF805 family)|nr:DUF805 domain-containing protein [Maledivibacter sp.]
MNIKNLFLFNGRINRKKYIFYQLVFPILILPLSFYNPDNIFLILIKTCLNLSIAIILVSKSVQRLHDMNFSGVVVLIPLILGFLGNFLDSLIFPMIVLGYYIHLMIKKGTIGPNKYGDDPLGPTKQTNTFINEAE